ncbi:C40 family peptidase [Brachybacterium sp. Marseille-Q7125]|uniref:C40 family peptidase n=1 Tax=Brachybacterium sp. Marseille-Q7125 TaxID=2932815 RepID=UPI001FF4DFB9
MSKTVKNTHRRAMRTVTPVTRAGRVGAGAAMAAAMLLGGGASATAEPQADGPQKIETAVAPAVTAPAVGIPSVEKAAEGATSSLSPLAGAISVEVGPTEEEIRAAEEAAREAEEQRQQEQAAAEQAEQNQTEQGQDEPETRADSNTASRSGERSNAQNNPSEQQSSESSAPAPSQAAAGSSILATARSGIGTPYVWGGTSPSGWDCSGFVQWVYAQHGINLPRGAAGQAAAGRVIPRSEARPGDLIYKPGHVGIYAGGNMMVDAGNARVGTSERNIYSGNWTFIRIGG